MQFWIELFDLSICQICDLTLSVHFLESYLLVNDSNDEFIPLSWLSICTSESSDLIDISDLGHGELILRLLGLWYCGILLSSGTGWSLAVV